MNYFDKLAQKEGNFNEDFYLVLFFLLPFSMYGVIQRQLQKVKIFILKLFNQYVFSHHNNIQTIFSDFFENSPSIFYF